MEKLPQDLRVALTNEINANLLEKFPVFKQHFSNKTMESILDKIEEKTFVHEETLF